MSDPRRASDDLLLRLLREGRHDAEVAVRLGVTTGELRERKRDLRNRLGDERYFALSGAGPARPPSRRRRWLWGGAGLAAGAFAVLLLAANIFAGESGSAEPVQPTGVVTPAPTTRSLAPPAPLQFEGRPFADLGRTFLSSSGASSRLGAIDHRAAMVVVPLEETLYLASTAAVEWTVRSSSLTDAFLRGTLQGRQIDVAIHAMGGARLRAVASGVGPVLEAETADGAGGAVLLIRATQGNVPVEFRLTSEGHMLLADAPLPAETVLDAFTGAALDVSGARQFGRMPRTAGTLIQNACHTPPPPTDNPAPPEGLRCRVLWLRTNRGFVVPADGTYACTGARSLEYVAGDIRLTFMQQGQSTVNFGCQPSQVAAGTAIIPDGEWVVVAEGVSIAVANDGQVYVGEIRGNVSCPCLPT